MIKFIDGGDEKKAVEDIMRNVNIYLNQNIISDKIESEIILEENMMELNKNLSMLVKQYEFLCLDIPESNDEKTIKKIIKRMISKAFGWYVKRYHKKQMDYNYYILSTLESEKKILEILLKMKGNEEI